MRRSAAVQFLKLWAGWEGGDLHLGKRVPGESQSSEVEICRFGPGGTSPSSDFVSEFD